MKLLASRGRLDAAATPRPRALGAAQDDVAAEGVEGVENEGDEKEGDEWGEEARVGGGVGWLVFLGKTHGFLGKTIVFLGKTMVFVGKGMGMGGICLGACRE